MTVEAGAGGAATAVETEVLRLDAERYRAFLNADVETLRELLDDRLGYGHSNTLRDGKAAVLEKLGSGTLRYSRLDHDVHEVVVAGADTVLVVGGMSAAAVSAGTPLELESVTLSVWARDPASGRWRLIAFQPTPRPKG
ncbi:nuclear transport factor 2 family protein [Herbiconiux ginsengi]|uniref:DUF4440 domain-containing protein n=1 Tax=Herbiconiux ginsengi TaxID=381665 RepID=A0A1H3QP14_9MICO|nr:nuclear transport factor 2 family protein [Herbiconiux ginsengi]SDZ15033.1 protein of unknown function [Herbiconiux ginsengi]